MRFSLRFLLLLTAVIAVVGCPILRPSRWWMFPIAPLVAVGMTIVAYVAVVSERWRAPMISFMAGVVSYFALALFIQMGFDAWDEVDTWWSFTQPLWTVMHGEAPINETVNGYEREDYLSFVIATHLIVAIVLSAASAWTVHLFASKRP